MLGKRTKARECAVQIIFQLDYENYTDYSQEYTFNELEIKDEDIKKFALTLTRGVQKNLRDIDKLIEKTLINWKIDRISSIDKALLRLGIYELVIEKDIDKKVTISEILKLAKIYSDVEAPKFINAILDRFEKTENFETCLKQKK